MSAQALPLAPRTQPFASPLQLVGVNYVRGGVTPEAGFDCFTLMAYVRWHWFAKLTPFAGIPARKLTTTQACAIGISRALGRRDPDGIEVPWAAIDPPSEGCAVALGRSRLGRLHHCGVWIEGGVLHAYESIGVVWSPAWRIGDLFARVEFYECTP